VHNAGALILSRGMLRLMTERKNAFNRKRIDANGASEPILMILKNFELACNIQIEVLMFS
jgi:hypothetical protein